MLAGGTGSDPRFALRTPTGLDGPRFYASLPARIAHELKAFRPDVVIAQSPFEGFAAELARRAARSPAKVVVEVHGDWHTSTRLYGSKLRPATSPVADAVARWALVHADAHRAISDHTAELLRELCLEPVDVFPTYSDLDAFGSALEPAPSGTGDPLRGGLSATRTLRCSRRRGRPSPARFRALTCGSSAVGGRRRSCRARRRGRPLGPELGPAEVARALDDARVLVVPSAAEGLGRVVIEAFLRGRPVVAARVGGLPELVDTR